MQDATTQGWDEIAITAEGAVLAARLYRPKCAAKAIILLNPATAVPQAFYRAFATWLAEQGHMVLTYDYRDFAASRRGSVRRAQATIIDWVIVDQQAALGEAIRQAKGLPVWIIGHSLGGLFLAWHKDIGAVDRIITVASGMVHVRDHPWPYQALARAFWYGPGPVLTAILGYMPGRLLGMGADLPRRVYWQWRRFSITKDFLVKMVGNDLPVPDFAALSASVKLVAMADDEMVPSKAVWRLMRLYPEAVKRQQVLREPGRRIGHVGVFRRENADLWPALIA